MTGNPAYNYNYNGKENCKKETDWSDYGASLGAKVFWSDYTLLKNNFKN